MPARDYEKAKRILELRDEGFTQQQVAEQLGCTQGNIHQIAKRNGIKFSNLRNQWGENNHNYQEGLARSTIERATRRAVMATSRNPRVCEKCGNYNEQREHPRHHIDRNRSNNSPDNIQVLCMPCHMEEHNGERIRDDYGRFIS